MTEKIRVTIVLEGSGINTERLEEDLQRFLDEDTRESIERLASQEITITDISE